MEAAKESRPKIGLGVPVHRDVPTARRILNWLVKDLEVRNPEAVLPDPGRPLVVIASHGSLMAPLPAMATVARIYEEHGMGDLVVGFFPHPLLLLVPGVRQMFEWLGTPTLAYDVDRLVGLMKEGRIHVAGTAPEGIHCTFTWDEYVAPLRSAGILETGILADAAVCLMAHRGAERWSLRLRLPLGMTVPLTRGLSGINLPLFPLLPLKDYRVMFERYKPAIRPSRLRSADHRERRMLLGVELEKIRNRLNLMTDELAPA